MPKPDLLAPLEQAQPAPEAAPAAPRATVSPETADLVDRVLDYVAQFVPDIAGASPAKRAELEEALRDEFGGAEAYVRSNRSARSRVTAEAILRHFNGRNATEVARKLGIGRTTVYRKIKTPGRK